MTIERTVKGDAMSEMPIYCDICEEHLYGEALDNRHSEGLEEYCDDCCPWCNEEIDDDD